MKSFLAKLVFYINHSESNQSFTFDEQVRILQADNQEQAFHQARRIGKKEEEVILNPENKKIHWQFVDVVEVYPLEELQHGDLVYSGTLEQDDPNNYISYIRRKSMEIQAKNLTFV